VLKAHLEGLPETTPVEIWFEDEARIGQKNGRVRQWARRGTWPRQPADQRYDNAYLFGAICPARCQIALNRGLIVFWCKLGAAPDDALAGWRFEGVCGSKGG
jgi:hypothetical protein